MIIGKIGRYEIQSLSGIGGMAAVYKAFDSQLKRTVAIKEVMSELLRDPRYVRRFEEEARLLAQIADPRVVTVYDFFRDGEKYYMVMEYVEGEPLSAYVQEPRLAAAEIHALLLEIAYGLRAVHRLGIVHRDVKPRNILLTSDRKIKIADFGIAKLMEKEPTIPEGTAKYLAPEVLEGTLIDGRTDIYSLGILAYELFLGNEKFNALFPEVYGTGGDLDLKWKSWHLDRLKRLKPLNELGVTLSPWLAAVLGKAVEKDIDARYQTIDALIKDLEAAREGGGGTRRFTKSAAAEATMRYVVPSAAAAKPTGGRRWLPVIAASALSLAAGLIVATIATKSGTGPSGETPAQAAAAKLDQAKHLVDAGRTLARAGQTEPARAKFRLAMDLLVQVKVTLPDDPRPLQMSKDILDLMKGLDGAPAADAYDRRMAEARAFKAQERWAEALDALARARAVAPSDAARDEIDAETARVRQIQSQAGTPAADPTLGVLEVDTVPPDAQVLLDGRERGRTPVRIDRLAPGPHALRVVSRFHEDEELSVDVAAGTVNRRVLTLQPAGGGLRVVTDPAGARLYLDYDWQRQPSPARIDQVPAGQHYLWAEKDDLGIEQAVFIERGKLTTADLRLERRARPPRVAAREQEREWQDLQDRIQDARARKDARAEAAAIDRALALRDAPELRERRSRLQASVALDEIRIREAAGDFAGALQVCAPVLKAAGDAPELRRAAARLAWKKDNLVRIAAGDSQLGSEGTDAEPDEKPARKVVLDECLLSKTEIPNALYTQFLDDIRRTRDHGRCHPAEPKDKDHAPTGWGTAAYADYSPRPDCPVVLIDWYDAYAFAAWMEMRLPTEAEWEKAACWNPAAGAARVYPWGNEWDPKRCNAEGAGDGWERAAPAGSFPSGASPAGALDMAGNVWEWCADWFDGYPKPAAEPLRNPKGPAAGDRRVARGGCWIDNRASVRSANRLALLPTDRGDGKVGIRVVQDVRK